MRKITNVDMIMPTVFTNVISEHKQFHRPGFLIAGVAYGRLRTFYIIEDQLFVVKDSGQYHMGSVCKSTLRALYAMRAPQMKENN
jgi:hypothetical protein